MAAMKKCVQNLWRGTYTFDANPLLKLSAITKTKLNSLNSERGGENTAIV